MFDLSITKILVLAVIALVVFGPNELPKVAAQAGKVLRDLRRIAEGAKSDLRENLGPEFQDFEFEDLNPRRFVQKHLLDGEDGNGARQFLDDLKTTTTTIGTGLNTVLNGTVNGDSGTATATASTTTATSTKETAAPASAQPQARLRDGDNPPFDIEAT